MSSYRSATARTVEAGQHADRRPERAQPTRAREEPAASSQPGKKTICGRDVFHARESTAHPGIQRRASKDFRTGRDPPAGRHGAGAV
jgi:hypothetical protein